MSAYCSHLRGLQINEDMVIFVYGVGVCIRFTTTPLEVLSTYKATVNVDV